MSETREKKKLNDFLIKSMEKYYKKHHNRHDKKHHKKNDKKHHKKHLKKIIISPCSKGPIGPIGPTGPTGPVFIPPSPAINSALKGIYIGYNNLLDLGTFDVTVMTVINYGYNLIILPFWIDNTIGVDPFSGAYYWSLLSQTVQKNVRAYANSVGAKIILSLGGSTFNRDGNGYTVGGGTAYGTNGANFAKANNFDGVDFDFENLQITSLTQTQLIQFMTDATNAAKTILGSNSLITHAPQSPYFNIEFNNIYLNFYKQTPTPPINYFLIQYYNQGATYLDYETQFINDDIFHPNTAIAQLISRGIPKNIIVLGKLTQMKDGAADSWVPPATIHQWIVQSANDPATFNWNTGVSTWQFNLTGIPTSQQWISTIYPN